MKILFLSDDFPPQSRGGAEIASFNLALVLKNKGHRLSVITITTDRNKVGESEYEGMKIFKIYSPEYHRIFTSYLSLYNPWTIGAVEEIMKREAPDIIHAQNIHHYLSYHCLKIAREYAKGVFLTAHDTMLFSVGKFSDFIDKSDLSIRKDFDYKVSSWKQLMVVRKRYNPFRNIIIRHYLKYTDKIFSITDILKKAMADNKIYNVETVHYGTDIKPTPISQGVGAFKEKFNLDDKKVILFGGRLSHQKGGAVAVSSLPLVVRDVPDAVLLIVGREDEYANYLKGLSKELGVADSVIFTGWLSRDEMNCAYSAADVVITPSLYFDAFNLFNLEAMASGKPVVGTCFGGTPEVIEDGVTGLVANPFDIEGFAEKISFLLNDPGLARTMGATGRMRASEEFSMERQAAQTLEWYQKFL